MHNKIPLSLQESAIAFLIESKCQSSCDKPSIMILGFVIVAAGILHTQAITAVFLMRNSNKEAGSSAESKTKSKSKHHDTAKSVVCLGM